MVENEIKHLLDGLKEHHYSYFLLGSNSEMQIAEIDTSTIYFVSVSNPTDLHIWRIFICKRDLRTVFFNDLRTRTYLDLSIDYLLS